MQKRGKNLHVKGAAFSEIFILIVATFAIAFVLAESDRVSADTVYYVDRDSGIAFQAPEHEGPDALVLQSRDGVNWEPAPGMNAGMMGAFEEVDRNTMMDFTEFGRNANERLGVGSNGDEEFVIDEQRGNSGDGLKVDPLADKGRKTTMPGPADALGGAAALKVLKPGDGQIWRDLTNDKVYSVANGKVYESTGIGKWGESKTMTSTGALREAIVADPDNFAKQYKSDLPFIKDLPAGGWSHLAEGVAFAAVAYGAGQMIGGFFGFSDEQKKALSTALAAGAFTYKALLAMSGQGGGFNVAGFGWITPGWAAVIGIGVAAAVFLMMYKKEETIKIKFSCEPWQAPVGGAKCEMCNKDPFRPCTEYRCKALGQACELKNKDSPGKEMCVWVAKDDVNSPKITTWTNALSPTGLRYVPDTTRPPALGTKIVRDGENPCLQAFTALQFGVVTDEPAQCKVDFNHTKKMEDMRYDFGETNLFLYNHTQRMKLPGPDIFNETTGQSSSPLFTNDGTTTLFVRCADANGNQNVDEFAVTFCVDKSPDTTPPLVTGTSVVTGSPVRFAVQSMPIEVYINEPAECRWSIQSKAFDDMENKMECITEPRDINAQLTYTCSGNLTGIKDKEENKYYFRCKDQPDAEAANRNVMTQSYELVLKGSQELNILSVRPNETVYGSTDAVAVDLIVETDDGSNEGNAFCYFSNTGENESYTAMFETNSFKHKQTLQLTSGEYTEYFKCVDLGGNSAFATTKFLVISDKQAPSVARVYNEEGMGLKVVTNEDAECAYSLTTCNFVLEDAMKAGLKLVYANENNKKSSYAEWKPNTVYYIKCRDFFGNEPNPNECSVIAGIIPQTSK